MPPVHTSSCLLVADIGATNSRFALFRTADGTAASLRLTWEQWFKGSEFPSFDELLIALSKELKQQISAETPAPALAVFAPAGPIVGDECRLTNLDWTVSASRAAQHLGIPKVFLVNDFAAQAPAVLLPEQAELVTIRPGMSQPGAPIAVTGAGTGFGKALLLPPPGLSLPVPVLPPGEVLSKIRILPSEGGQVEFPFVGSGERQFSDFACRHFTTERPTADMIVSGAGLACLASFFSGAPIAPENAPADARPEAVALFSRFYGRLCRNYVLDTLALGGLVITGGMAARVPVVEHPAFLAEFTESAKQKALLERVPVLHMRSQSAGLWGAALHGLLLLHKEPV